MKLAIRICKIIGWLWVASCVVGGLTSLRHGDMQYSAWILGSSWPGALLLMATYSIQRWRSKRL